MLKVAFLILFLREAYRKQKHMKQIEKQNLHTHFLH